jgi:hypothetical protein
MLESRVAFAKSTLCGGGPKLTRAATVRERYPTSLN